MIYGLELSGYEDRIKDGFTRNFEVFNYLRVVLRIFFAGAYVLILCIKQYTMLGKILFKRTEPAIAQSSDEHNLMTFT